MHQAATTGMFCTKPKTLAFAKSWFPKKMRNNYAPGSHTWCFDNSNVWFLVARKHILGGKGWGLGVQIWFLVTTKWVGWSKAWVWGPVHDFPSQDHNSRDQKHSILAMKYFSPCLAIRIYIYISTYYRTIKRITPDWTNLVKVWARTHHTWTKNLTKRDRAA